MSLVDAVQTIAKELPRGNMANKSPEASHCKADIQTMLKQWPMLSRRYCAGTHSLHTICPQLTQQFTAQEQEILGSAFCIQVDLSQYPNLYITSAECQVSFPAVLIPVAILSPTASRRVGTLLLAG